MDRISWIIIIFYLLSSTYILEFITFSNNTANALWPKPQPIDEKRHFPKEVEDAFHANKNHTEFSI